MAETVTLPEARQWNNSPVLMHPDFIRSAASDFLTDRQGLMPHQAPLQALSAAYGRDFGTQKPFAFADGVAIIPISGSLYHRFSGSWGWATGYDAIRSQLSAALVDADVKAIVFDVNSGGGDAAGVFELSEEIFNARGKKPMHAVVDAHAYSAAYALASAADRITVTKTGGVGSIGVVTAHVDMSKALDKAGVEITMIYAGKHKVDGNPYQPLKPAVKAHIQARVDTLYDEFVSTVARNRGIDEAAVRGTEAATYGSAEALKLGLVDAIGAPQEALAALFADLTGKTKMEQPHMADQTVVAPASAAAPAAAVDAAAITADASQKERARISAITTCEEAKGREQLAQHFAFNTAMSPEDAKAALAAAPIAAVATPAKAGNSAFLTAMENGNPNVGAGNDGDEGSNESAETPVNRLLGAYKAASGIDLKAH